MKLLIMNKFLVSFIVLLMFAGCATLTNDSNTPIALAFSDGSKGSCNLTNKRGSWNVNIPGQVDVRRSDDSLRYNCSSEDGRTAFGAITSEWGAKQLASAVFLDFGIVDAITYKHRKYTNSFVIPIQ